MYMLSTGDEHDKGTGWWLGDVTTATSRSETVNLEKKQKQVRAYEADLTNTWHKSTL